ncbi:UNVERIFIED_CONTAM: hypothetical protein FKN15_007643 [Acipenser sinensis]
MQFVITWSRLQDKTLGEDEDEDEDMDMDRDRDRDNVKEDEMKIEIKTCSDGCSRLLPDQLETAVVEMVRAKNDIHLTEIQRRTVEDNNVFEGVNTISLPAMTPILQRHQVTMKQIDLVPFERNNPRVKQQRAECFQIQYYSEGIAV